MIRCCATRLPEHVVLQTLHGTIYRLSYLHAEGKAKENADRAVIWGCQLQLVRADGGPILRKVLSRDTLVLGIPDLANF